MVSCPASACESQQSLCSRDHSSAADIVNYEGLHLGVHAFRAVLGLKGGVAKG